MSTCSGDYYFCHDDFKRSAPGLKSIEEATAIRGKFLYAFEAAEREHDPAKRREWLTFVMVGGGPTGVELAGALGEIAHDTLRRDFRSIHPEEAVILLLEGGPRILPSYSPDLSAKAEASLIRLGVTPRTNAMAIGIDDAGVTIKTASGTERIRVNSLHSQGVKELGAGLAVEARATDGVIEAFRVEAAQNFALALQWRPEWRVATNEFSRALFAEFGAACRDRT